MILAPSPLTIPSNSAEWPAWLQSFLDRNEPESSCLDYKSGRVLQTLGGNKSDTEKTEFTKDLSAMANSSGGLILYGIEEKQDEHKFKKPTVLSPVSASTIREDDLYQIARSILPRLPGLRIKAIQPDGERFPGLQCFAVEIAQSATIHQAQDKRYHRRNGATTRMMDDYEIREGLNRQIHPAVISWAHVRPPSVEKPGNIHIEIENIGRVLCHDFCVRLTLPFFIKNVWFNPRGHEVRTATISGEKGLCLTFTGKILHPGMKQFLNIEAEKAEEGQLLNQSDNWLESWWQLETFADSAPREALLFHVDSLFIPKRPPSGLIEQMSKRE